MIVAITRTDIASYVLALVWIYTILLLIRILLTWAVMVPFVVELLQNPVLRTIVGFVEDVTEPYLQMFRRIIPPLRAGPGLIDVSPIIAIFALGFVGSIVAALIRG